ncbi:hypothetical protein PRIPAC_79779 [Pristionchus pacificus]|uniref:G protein-coupled receptor n=1 Tax=Pristionchus pacificus TaxID=54126 RepID=A0A2A6CPC9_PRIPA|nr:hypothetical protein PRIPAC_79779 [Pristionchus pacificus]|eukprot:PDM79956.1 G protein-coupled receptor [Pristionchus pacificus]
MMTRSGDVRIIISYLSASFTFTSSKRKFRRHSLDMESDLLHLAIVYSLDGTAIAVNILLIGIIIARIVQWTAHRTPPSMSAYSVVLLHNAFIDLISATASALASARCNFTNCGAFFHGLRINRALLHYFLQKIICSNDGTMVEIYLGTCTKLGGMRVCNACQTTHMTFVNLSVAILLISFYYRLRAISDSSVHIQSPLRVWLLCSTTYIPVAIVWSVTHQSQHKYIARALTYQLLLPCTLAISATIWLLDVTGVYSSEWPQRLTMVSSSAFALASPIINLVHLPPYRRCFTWRRSSQGTNDRDYVLDSRTTRNQYSCGIWPDGKRIRYRIFMDIIQKGAYCTFRNLSHIICSNCNGFDIFAQKATLSISTTVIVSHQKSIARALTYQSLRPCTLAIAATIWLLDVTGVYYADYPQCMIMMNSAINACIFDHPSTQRAHRFHLSRRERYGGSEISSVICSSDGTMVEIYLGACSEMGRMPICNVCPTTHMTFVNLSIAILLISFHYRLRAISDSSVHSQSPLRVWLLCSITYVPVGCVWYLYYISARVTPEDILLRYGLSGKGYVTAWYTLADTAPVVLVVFIIVFSPSVMINVFFMRRRLLCRIAQTSVALQSHHKYIAMALTYQTLLPCTLAVAAIIWLLDLAGVYSSEWPQRMIMVSSSLFALASPLINLSYLPPYRRFLTRRRSQKTEPTRKQVAPIPETSD